MCWLVARSTGLPVHRSANSVVQVTGKYFDTVPRSARGLGEEKGGPDEELPDAECGFEFGLQK